VASIAASHADTDSGSGAVILVVRDGAVYRSLAAVIPKSRRDAMNLIEA